MSLKVIGIGEVLWDVMPAGKQLGGAPANFAYHARALGAEAFVITRVGEDALGTEVLRRFKEMGIADGVVQVDAAKPTGTVAVELHDGGVPQFTIREDVAWDWIAATDPAREAVRDADAICFGTLAQRNATARASIQELLKAAPADALRVLDVNLRQHYFDRELVEQSLRLANVLKLNATELPVLAEMFELGTQPQQQIQRLAALFQLRLVALTRGAQGSLLYQKGRWSEEVSEPIMVVDTVGAGDAFTAAVTMGLLNEVDLDEFHAVAAEVARFVCAHAGATPPLPEQLRNKFSGMRRLHSEGTRYTRAAQRAGNSGKTQTNPTMV